MSDRVFQGDHAPEVPRRTASVTRGTTMVGADSRWPRPFTLDVDRLDDYVDLTEAEARDLYSALGAALAQWDGVPNDTLSGFYP